jgi:hypothetical protein
MFKNPGVSSDMLISATSDAVVKLIDPTSMVIKTKKKTMVIKSTYLFTE